MTKVQKSLNMVRDIARNSYERGFDDGFKKGFKRGIGAGMGWCSLGWGSVLLILVGVAMMSGCSPYAGFVAGYSEDGGDYWTLDQRAIREDGGSAIAYMGARRDFTEHLSGLCQLTHFSTFTNYPEVAVNHVGCGIEIK